MSKNSQPSEWVVRQRRTSPQCAGCSFEERRAMCGGTLPRCNVCTRGPERADLYTNDAAYCRLPVHP